MKTVMMFEPYDSFILPPRNLQGEIVKIDYICNEDCATARCEVSITGDNPYHINYIFHNLNTNEVFFGRTDISATPISYNNRTIELRENV